MLGIRKRQVAARAMAEDAEDYTAPSSPILFAYNEIHLMVCQGQVSLDRSLASQSSMGRMQRAREVDGGARAKPIAWPQSPQQVQILGGAGPQALVVFDVLGNGPRSPHTKPVPREIQALRRRGTSQGHTNESGQNADAIRCAGRTSTIAFARDPHTRAHTQTHACRPQRYHTLRAHAVCSAGLESVKG